MLIASIQGLSMINVYVTLFLHFWIFGQFPSLSDQYLKADYIC